MLEALSLAAATALAKIVLDKFFEGAGQKLEATATELGETVVAKANAKIMQLGELIWQRCFKGKDVDKRLEAAAQGSEPDTQVLQEYVHNALEADSSFAEQAKQIAGEIHQVIMNIDEVKAKNMQQNLGGQNLQVNDPQAPVIQAENSPITINYTNG
ncbi:MAG: hypothetical protein AAGE59_27830 [Cyanobacteria bacterium P01_F01_bin.86]